MEEHTIPHVLKKPRCLPRLPGMQAHAWGLASGQVYDLEQVCLSINCSFPSYRIKGTRPGLFPVLSNSSNSEPTTLLWCLPSSEPLWSWGTDRETEAGGSPSISAPLVAALATAAHLLFFSPHPELLVCLSRVLQTPHLAHWPYPMGFFCQDPGFITHLLQSAELTSSPLTLVS